MKEKNQQLIVKKERFFKIDIPLPFILKVIGYIGILFIIWCILFYFKYVKIYITYPKTSRNTRYFYITLVSIMLLVFMVACGFVFDIKNKKTKFFLFCIILILIIYEYTEIGLGIRFRGKYANLLLEHKRLESDNINGIYFFILNFLGFWIFIYLLSFLFESEK